MVYSDYTFTPDNPPKKSGRYHFVTERMGPHKLEKYTGVFDKDREIFITSISSIKGKKEARIKLSTVLFHKKA